jgi:hypothetical protein
MIRIRAFTVRVGYPYGEAVTAISGLANSADFVFIQAAFVFTDFHKFILKKFTGPQGRRCYPESGQVVPAKQGMLIFTQN